MNITKAHSKKRRTAVVEDSGKGNRLIAQLLMPANAVLKQRETKNQACRPECQQQNQRQRPEVSKKTLLPRDILDARGNLSPRNPRPPVEPRRQFEMPRHPAGQHHGLKRIQQHHAYDDGAKDNRGNAAVRAHDGFSTANLDAEGRVTDSGLVNLVSGRGYPRDVVYNASVSLRQDPTADPTGVSIGAESVPES